jgi:predicted unusual protein kinase regulating ubiquinone biosynthesis (AarF/ABC1/UbiB family)
VAQAWQTMKRRNTAWRSYRVGLLLLRTLYIINRERTRVIRARERGDYEARPNVEALVRVLRNFRRTAVALGGLLIKLGQFLGARADLLPKEALDELASLHDEVPAESFADIERVLEREWGGPTSNVCASIDPVPAGAASLGQVHHARLLDGREVAVKVQRPGIGRIVRTDLRTLRFVLRVVRRLVPAANEITDLDVLYREFARTVAEELDYKQEAHNAERFADMFAEDVRVRVPSVIEEHSTRRVLVLQWMDGIKITDIPALDAAGVNRKELADHLAGTYFKQVLTDSFFHADPHPGNILVQPDAAGDRIVFLDFGMMGVITPRMQTGLRDCLRGIVAQDAALVVRGLDTLGFFGKSVNREALERVVGAMLSQFTSSAAPSGDGRTRGRGPRGGRGREVDPRDVLVDMESTVYDQPFRLPAQFAFFGRMAGMLLGLTAALSSSFDFLAVARPYAAQFMGENGFEGVLRLLGVDSFEALGRDLLRGGIATARSLAELPQRIDRLAERAERGELRVIVSDAALNGHAPQGRNGARGLAPAAVLTRSVPIWIPVVVAGAFALGRFARRGPEPGRR